MSSPRLRTTRSTFRCRSSICLIGDFPNYGWTLFTPRGRTFSSRLIQMLGQRFFPLRLSGCLSIRHTLLHVLQPFSSLFILVTFGVCYLLTVSSTDVAFTTTVHLHSLYLTYVLCYFLPSSSLITCLSHISLKVHTSHSLQSSLVSSNVNTSIYLPPSRAVGLCNYIT